jgi:hypothetical protein
MTRLTLEPLERRELLSANLLAEGLGPPAPPANSQLEFAGTLNVPYTYPDHNNLLTVLTSLPRPETNGRSQSFTGDGPGSAPSIIAVSIGLRSAADSQGSQVTVGRSDLGGDTRLDFIAPIESDKGPFHGLNDIGAPGGRSTGFGLPASDAMGEDTAYTHNQSDLEFLLVNSTENDRFAAPWATFPGSFSHAVDTPDRAGFYADRDVNGDGGLGTDARGWLPGRFIDASLIYGSSD